MGMYFLPALVIRVMKSHASAHSLIVSICQEGIFHSLCSVYRITQLLRFIINVLCSFPSQLWSIRYWSSLEISYEAPWVNCQIWCGNPTFLWIFYMIDLPFMIYSVIQFDWVVWQCACCGKYGYIYLWFSRLYNSEQKYKTSKLLSIAVQRQG